MTEEEERRRKKEKVGVRICLINQQIKNALSTTSSLSQFSYFAINMFLRIFQFGNWYSSRIANVKFGFRVTQSVTTLLVGNNYATTNTTVFQLQFYTQKKRAAK